MTSAAQPAQDPTVPRFLRVRTRTVVWHSRHLEIRIYSYDECCVQDYAKVALDLSEWFARLGLTITQNEWSLGMNQHGLFYRCTREFHSDQLDWSSLGPPRLKTDPAKAVLRDKLLSLGWKEGKGS